MYLSAWPALPPSLLLRRPPRTPPPPPFPLGARGTLGFHVARYGIYQLLRALGLGPQDTLLVPAYHHGNEVRAIRAAGARVEFYPIGLDLQPDLDDLERRLRARPRALYVIHYLGWPQPIRELARACREHGVLLIEDCALALLSDSLGQPLGSFGDYAVFCLYKTLPVPNGGLVAQNREPLEGLAGLRLASCGAASLAGRSLELVGDWVRRRSELMGRALVSARRGGGRALTALGVRRPPVGDSGFDASRAGLAMSSLTQWLLPRFDCRAIRERRRHNYALLAGRLRGRVPLLLERLDGGVCPLFFPLLVEDKPRAAAWLRQRGIDTVMFWNHGDQAAEQAGFAEARFLRRHVLELPIHQDLDQRDVHYLADRVVELSGTLRPPSWPCYASNASKTRIA